MQNFMPIGCTTAEISVPDKKKRDKKQKTQYQPYYRMRVKAAKFT